MRKGYRFPTLRAASSGWLKQTKYSMSPFFLLMKDDGHNRGAHNGNLYFLGLDPFSLRVYDNQSLSESSSKVCEDS